MINMEEYAKSLEMLEIRKCKSEYKLTDTELKVYRKYIKKKNGVVLGKVADKIICLCLV